MAAKGVLRLGDKVMWNREAVRFLNSGAVVSIGRISYSTYLWQQLFLNKHETGLLQTFPMNMVATFCCATISYIILEQPLNKLRKRLRPSVAATGLSFTNWISGP